MKKHKKKVEFWGFFCLSINLTSFVHFWEKLSPNSRYQIIENKKERKTPGKQHNIPPI
jgi:hypothetical protein